MGISEHGVRGIGYVDSVSDPLYRSRIERLFSKELCSEIVLSASEIADEAVLVGWDRRPSNPERLNPH